MDKSHEALLSADSEKKANRLPFAVNRAYYACFYALSAVLMKKGLSYKSIPEYVPHSTHS